MPNVCSVEKPLGIKHPTPSKRWKIIFLQFQAALGRFLFIFLIQKIALGSPLGKNFFRSKKKFFFSNVVQNDKKLILNNFGEKIFFHPSIQVPHAGHLLNQIRKFAHKQFCFVLIHLSLCVHHFTCHPYPSVAFFTPPHLSLKPRTIATLIQNEISPAPSPTTNQQRACEALQQPDHRPEGDVQP